MESYYTRTPQFLIAVRRGRLKLVGKLLFGYLGFEPSKCESNRPFSIDYNNINKSLVFEQYPLTLIVIS